MLTSRDYRLSTTPPDARVADLMTKFADLVYGQEGITLSEANDLIWKHKLNCLPVITKNGPPRVPRLPQGLRRAQGEPLRARRRRTSAWSSARASTPATTRSGCPRWWRRVPTCSASTPPTASRSGRRTRIQWIRKNYGESVKVGGGNVVDAEGFRYLAEAGADFVKVGIGGGSICITREQKGIGRGPGHGGHRGGAGARRVPPRRRASTCRSAPTAGIVQDYHIVLALAMGADFVMMGRFFARFDEAPGRRLRIGGQLRQGILGRGLQPRAQLAALPRGRAGRASASRRAWTATCRTRASSRTTSTSPWTRSAAPW